jgi:hypothetical protein
MATENQHTETAAAAPEAPRSKYTILKAFLAGHVFLRENATGRIAVGDQSGYIHGDCRYYVERTDDGVLWLDITRPVTLVKRSGRRQSHQLGYFVSIPLLNSIGKATSTIGTDAEASFCHSIGMDVVGSENQFVAEIIAIKRAAIAKVENDQ